MEVLMSDPIATMIQKKQEEIQALQRLQSNPDFQKLFGQGQFAQMLQTGATPQDIVSIVPAKIEDRKFENGELILPPQPASIELNNAPSGIPRRLKATVDKKPVKERDLLPEERSEIITLMNKRQDLLPHDEGNGEGLCQKLCDKFNRKNPRLVRVYPYQISGYYSHLCRMAMKPAVEREGWFEAACKLGKVLPEIRPVFTKAFIAKVTKNWKETKENEASMKRDHSIMITERREKGLIR
jgi:hypothetical protein